MTDRLEHERSFDLFGSHVRLLIGAPTRDGLPSPEAIALQIQGFMLVLHRRLTRFDPGSELCGLNASADSALRVSSTLATAVDAAVWAAHRSGGLIDPTLLGDLERAGYANSRANLPSTPIAKALPRAPARTPAQPAPVPAWRSVAVDRSDNTVSRPPGTRLDLGGTAKGLAADLAADRLAGYSIFVVDAGGDLRIGGERPEERLVRIEHPLRPEPAHELILDHGAVATSGVKTRLWRTESGFAHHLLDPSTGEPAWTGIVQATALGVTALEAETLAKMAFLSGPEAAAKILEPGGGLVVLDDGTVQLFGSLPAMSESAEAVPT
jgi:thiamine biosynthesis lipoprotein